jgi:hypothetical protein
MLPGPLLRRALAALLLSWLLLTPAAPVAAATQHVTDCGDAGTNTLRGRIAAAAVGDTIVFNQDCTGATAITLTTGTLTLTKDVTIDGTGHTVIVDGGCTGCDPGGTPSGGVTVFAVNSGVKASITGLTVQHGGGRIMDGVVFRVLSAGAIENDGTLTIINSTIRANTAGTAGGGIFNHGGNLTVARSTISDNRTANNVNGGGIATIGGTLAVTNTTLSGNITTNGDGGGLFTGGSTTVTDSTFSGNSALNGGGIDSSGGSTLTMTRGMLTGNSATLHGGGINVSGIATVTSSTMSGNNSNQGGGVYNDDMLTLASSTISGNTAFTGGGIFNGRTLTVTANTISNNTATSNGGGIFNQQLLTVTASTISGNSASGGGGIHNQQLLTVMSSTLSMNSATGDGGGINNDTSANTSATVTNSTFNGNSAGNFGGGIHNVATMTLTNSTLAGNSAPAVGTGNGGGIWSGGGSDILKVTNTIVANNPGADLAGRDPIVDSHNVWGGSNGPPLLAPLGNYGGPTHTIALLPGSPAIDRADDAVCAATGDGAVGGLDQRRIVRPQGAQCDIGAFESRGFALTISGGTNQTASVSTPFAAPLAVTLTSPDGASPLSGAFVTFTPPGSGASATLTGSPATTDASGGASVTATANDTVGTYTVTASTPGAADATFTLSNTPPTAFTGISPASGNIAGGNRVTLTGVGFGTAATTQVLIDGTAIPAASLTSVAGTRIVFVAPAHAAGNVTVTVKVGGTTLAGSVTYTYGAMTPLPGAKPPAPVGGPADPLPVARPAGPAGGSAPSPLPVSRP